MRHIYFSENRRERGREIEGGGKKGGFRELKKDKGKIYVIESSHTVTHTLLKA